MEKKPTRAHISRAAIERLYIEMRHLLMRGRYKPLGKSGESMIEALHSLNPEIYGSIRDENKVELDGLLYVFQRLPQGIEQCRYIKLISREGLESSAFVPIIPTKRRRNCYRIDEEQMFIEMTRGRSDVYDILTHLTFMYNEAEKIGRHSLNSRFETNRAWNTLQDIVKKRDKEEDFDYEVALTYLSTLLGRTYDETSKAYEKFRKSDGVNDLFAIVYWLGKLSVEESIKKEDREISFSESLIENLGHHIYGEKWANNIKHYLLDHDLYSRPVHVISANMHSVMNSLYSVASLGEDYSDVPLSSIAIELSKPESRVLGESIRSFALSHGMYELSDRTGTNIPVQIIDFSKIDCDLLPFELKKVLPKDLDKNFVIIVMDYAFGEQAYETMDELLKPLDHEGDKKPINIVSVNIMGKAGILCGGKGDIMVATAHIMEGMADNYPFENELTTADFLEYNLPIYEGNMITVLGTSLQNEDILRYFLKSSWAAIGLEMEGAHYQKAIQANSKVRKSINPDVKVRYAYYASDNPLESGSTLASGSLGIDGVKPTYAITIEILRGILRS
jgi:hypothetical protein